jgi:flagellar biosynthesis/type III secretory pathway protein FliH
MKSPFVFPTQIEPGSIADQLLKKGRQEGFEEGWQEGFEQGRQEGFEEGRQEAIQEFEISCIQILQECLGVPVESTSSLQSCSLDELRLKTADLRSRIQRRLKP